MRLRFMFILALAMALTLQSNAAGQADRPPSAQSLLDAALKHAKAENKNVFVDFWASWCGPCLRLRQYVETPAVSSVLRRHFVIVSIAVMEQPRLNNPGGDALLAELGGYELPYYIVLDSLGKPIPNAKGEGLPWNTASMETFTAMLASAAPSLTPADRATLMSHLPVLSAARSAMPLSSQIVWAPTRMDIGARPSISADGRYLVFNNQYEWGHLFIRDLETQTDRRVVSASGPDGKALDGEVWEQAIMSPDNRWLAFAWRNRTTKRSDLRLLGLEATGAAPRVLLALPDAEWIRPSDWSPDLGSIAVQIGRKSGVDLALVSPRDGAVRVVATLPGQIADINWAGMNTWSTNMVFTKDGRYLAVDVYADAEGRKRDIILFAVDSSRRIPAVTHPRDDAVVGWMPDGRRLLFTSDRTGRTTLWTTAFVNGEFGPPELIPQAPDVREATTMGLTADGAFLYAVDSRPQIDIWSAAVDFNTGNVTAKPTIAIESFTGSNSRPVLSPTGDRVAYSSRRRLDENRLIIRSMDDGREEEFGVTPAYVYWSPSGRRLALVDTSNDRRVLSLLDLETRSHKVVSTNAGFVQTWLSETRLVFLRAIRDPDLPQLTGVVELDLETGRERELFRDQLGGGGSIIASDGRAFYFRRPPRIGPVHDLIARDLETGAERTIVPNVQIASLTISPDGKRIVAESVDEAGAKVLLLVPTDGTPARRLSLGDRDSALRQIGDVHFAPNGRSLLVQTSVGNRNEVWWVPVDGRAPRQIDLALNERMSNVSIRTDGRILFEKTSPELPAAVWKVQFGSGPEPRK